MTLAEIAARVAFAEALVAYFEAGPILGLTRDTLLAEMRCRTDGLATPAMVDDFLSSVADNLPTVISMMGMSEVEFLEWLRHQLAPTQAGPDGPQREGSPAPATA